MRTRRSSVEKLEARRLFTAIPYHLQLAEQLVSNITAANNTYAYGASTVTWAGLNGATTYKNQSDCSTFDTALLSTAYGYTSSQFVKWTGVSSPQAKDYYNAAIADDGFIGYSNVTSVQPGDDMFMKYLDSSTDTGHVVTIAAAPTLVSTTSTQMAYNLTVIDCTASPHTNDTRSAANNGGTAETGVGEGTMRIYTDLSGNLTAYSWGTSSSSVVETSATRPATFAKVPVPALVAATAPTAPTNLKATASAGGTNTLTWTDNSTNETGFTIQRSVSGAPFTVLTTVAANTTSYADTKLTAGTKYTYRIAAYNSVGSSTWVTSLSTTALGTTTTAVVVKKQQAMSLLALLD